MHELWHGWHCTWMQQAIFRLVSVAIMCLLPVAATAQDEIPFGPSFDCSKAQTPTEKQICADGNLLAGMDRKLAGVFAEAKSKDIAGVSAEQRNWLKKRNRCGDNADCIFRQYAARLADLARQLGDEQQVSGIYAYQLSPETNFGELWFVRDGDGTASGGLLTVSGPTFHFCTLEFQGARAIGDAWIWSRPAAQDVPECTVLFRPGKQSIRIDALGCRQYCGARGWFDADYKR